MEYIFVSFSLIKNLPYYLTCTLCPKKKEESLLRPPSISVPELSVRSDIGAVGLYVSSCLFLSLFFVYCFCLFLGKLSVLYYLQMPVMCFDAVNSLLLLIDNLCVQTCTSIDSSEQKRKQKKKDCLYFTIKQSSLCLETISF